MANAVRLVYAIQILFALNICRAADLPLNLEEIPFKFRDGFIWIEVTLLDNPIRLHFLLDTGAQVSVIDTSTAHRLGMKRSRPVTVVGVGNTTTGFWPQVVHARAGKVQLPRNLLMLDLGKLSEACTNSTVDGIIGADFFHDRIVQVDFQNQAVRILHEPPAETGLQVLPLKVRPCGMLVPVQVDHAKAEWVRLDTGCATALQWVTAGVRAEECTKRVAVALTTFSIPVTQTTLALGAVRFENVPTDLQAKEIFPGEKGLLGNGMLSRFQTVTIDAKRKEVILGPVSQVSH